MDKESQKQIVRSLLFFLDKAQVKKSRELAFLVNRGIHLTETLAFEIIEQVQCRIDHKEFHNKSIYSEAIKEVIDEEIPELK